MAEWKRSRICACILLLANLSLSGAVLMILFQKRGYEYDGILIYVIALYTFYSTIHAIVDIVRYRKLGSPVLSTAKIVSLSAALVSMLNLETAMFAQFGGDMALEHQQIFIILTGAGVSVIVVTLSVMLIVRATNRERVKWKIKKRDSATHILQKSSRRSRQSVKNIFPGKMIKWSSCASSIIPHPRKPRQPLSQSA